MKKAKPIIAMLLSTITLFGCGATNNVSEVEDNTEQTSGSATLAESEESIEESSELNEAFCDQYVTEYTIEDEVFVTEKNSFYSSFLKDCVDKEISFSDNYQFDPSKVWNPQIQETKNALYEKLSADDKLLLEMVDNSWNLCVTDFSELDYILYEGIDNVIMGSMYCEILPYKVFTEYELYAGALMALEYELSDEYISCLSNISVKTDVSSAQVSKFSPGTVCMEWGVEIQNTVKEYRLEELSILELEEQLRTIANEFDEKSEGKTNVDKCVEDYIAFTSDMYELECSVTGRIDRCEKVRSKRLVLLIDQLVATIKIMPNSAEAVVEDSAANATESAGIAENDIQEPYKEVRLVSIVDSYDYKDDETLENGMWTKVNNADEEKEYSKDDNGKIVKVKYLSDSYTYGTYNSSGVCYYDSKERPLYRDYYVTSGGRYCYYLYNDQGELSQIFDFGGMPYKGLEENDDIAIGVDFEVYMFER